eukprot:m.14139 g.14139  ORF g.14139 m.14139 type:complete len:194 (+) comp7764_c0_seq2:1603-2184(+)
MRTGDLVANSMMGFCSDTAALSALVVSLKTASSCSEPPSPALTDSVTTKRLAQSIFPSAVLPSRTHWSTTLPARNAELAIRSSAHTTHTSARRILPTAADRTAPNQKKKKGTPLQKFLLLVRNFACQCQSAGAFFVLSFFPLFFWRGRVWHEWWWSLLRDLPSRSCGWGGRHGGATVQKDGNTCSPMPADRAR